MNDKAPIVLFVYKRLEHTMKTINSLKSNILSQDSDLYIFSDGYKNIEDKQKVNEVRVYLRKIDGFKSINIIERERNIGLAESIISGVTKIVNKYGKVIVIEDDLILSPYFLNYMNDALDLYKDEMDVISIHGYVYPIKQKLDKTFFLRGADCWGWATWKRGWDLFEPDGKKLLNQLKKECLEKTFDFNGEYNYTNMLKDQIDGKNNSWAIRWYASAFLKNKLTLYPGISLVHNIGNDNSGTHSFKTDVYDNSVQLAQKVDLEKINISENVAMRYEFEKYFKSLKKSKIQKIISLLFTRN